MQACGDPTVQLVADGKKWHLHRPRQLRDKAKEAACDVKSKQQHKCPPDRTVESKSNQRLPPGTILVARRPQEQVSKPVLRSSSPSRVSDKPSTVTNATQSSEQKAFRPLPNQADPKTGWGPIENLTVATLDFQQGKNRVPQQHQAFKELADWIYDHTLQHSGQQKVGDDHDKHAAAAEAGVTPRVEYYQRLAAQLLTLHNNANTNLQQLEPGPKLNTAAHCARQLWNSIPQADNMPAARQDAEQLATALDMALADSANEQALDNSGKDWEPPWKREKEVWGRMEVELARQVSVHCHAQGRLLQLALKQRNEREAAMEAEVQSLRAAVAESSAAAQQAQTRAVAAEKECAEVSKLNEQNQKSLQQLQDEVDVLRTKRDEMVIKYRRWDVIDAQVRQREHQLQEQMQVWMQRTQEELASQYEARYLDAIKATLAAGEDTSDGANSALLPEIV